MMYVVIVDFNGWQYTRSCLESLSTGRGVDFGIIVVDHGTTDETRSMLAARFPQVVHLAGSPTLWWAGATNLGVREAVKRGADSILLLNNDCTVAPDTISVLKARLDESENAIVAAIPANDGERRSLILPTTCFLLGFPTIYWPWNLRFLTGRRKLIATPLIAGGRAALVPATVFERVGMFDEEHLPHYGADHDFYLRCRSRGVPLYLAPEAKVYVDNTRTSAANDPGRLGLRGFIDTLTDRHSHRNLKDLAALFRRHYPIKSLYLVGLTLNFVRYTLLYLFKRPLFLIRRGEGPA